MSFALPGEVVKPTTSAPSALASFTATCPSPPRPMTPTVCPGPTSHRLSGTQVVIPAHISGAVPAGSSASGRRYTNAWSATYSSLNPPWVRDPSCRSRPA